MKIAIFIGAGMGVLILCGSLAGQTKLDDEQAKLLQEARDESLAYSGSLPDFLCTETVKRRADPRGENRWRPIDTLTVRLSYSGHREDYKLMAIDGRRTTLDYLKAGGSLTTGEFGSRLIALFIPESKAEFEWKGWARVRGRRVAVWHYRIAKENSSFQLQAGAAQVGPDALVVAYRGEVSIDEQTHRVLRLTSQAEIPLGFPISESTSLVEYDFRKVGGKQFLLPVHAEARMRRGTYLSENEVEFSEYRKFETEATISFDTLDEKLKPPPVEKK